MLATAIHWAVTGGAIVALPFLCAMICRDLRRACAYYSAIRNELERN